MQVAVVAFAALLLSACTGGGNVKPPPSSASATGGIAGTPAPTPVPAILPGARIVAYYGAPDTPSMGVLGVGSPAQAAGKLAAQARAYAGFGRRVQPAFELIVVAAQSAPGASGASSGRVANADIVRYVAAARAMHALTILDIQPGHRKFIDEVRHLRPWLEQPDIELALDPEWSMAPGEVPGKTIGGTTGDVVNGVATELSALVTRKHLPQKLLVVHEFTPEMIEGRSAIHPQPGLAIVFHVDGFGQRALKLHQYGLLAAKPPFYTGFKLFYEQDVKPFSAREVMQLHPVPDLITYQ